MTIIFIGLKAKTTQNRGKVAVISAITESIVKIVKKEYIAILCAFVRGFTQCTVVLNADVKIIAAAAAAGRATSLKTSVG